MKDSISKNKKDIIGKVNFIAGEPVSSGVVEMTSQGPQVNGLDSRKWISAGYAVHIYGGSKKAYVKPVYEKVDTVSSPVVEITNGTRVGLRYLNFGTNTPKTVIQVTPAL